MFGLVDDSAEHEMTLDEFKARFAAVPCVGSLAVQKFLAEADAKLKAFPATAAVRGAFVVRVNERCVVCETPKICSLAMSLQVAVQQGRYLASALNGIASSPAGEVPCFVYKYASMCLFSPQIDRAFGFVGICGQRARGGRFWRRKVYT